MTSLTSLTIAAAREGLRRKQFSALELTDAYLAAFARCAGMQLVTFDTDFARFEGLDLLVLA